MNVRFATSNRHKFEEASRIASKFGLRLEWLKGERIEIQGEELGEIAEYSLRMIPRRYDPVFVEDAGLFIRALNWFPGPYSSYVFGKLGNRGILKLMEGIDDRYAEFRSAVALRFRGFVAIFFGVAKGSIAFEERGSHGFGFDPIFVPEGSELTFSELGEAKDRYSHRAKSIASLSRFLLHRTF